LLIEAEEAAVAHPAPKTPNTQKQKKALFWSWQKTQKEKGGGQRTSTRQLTEAPRAASASSLPCTANSIASRT
jgi:hypothetical protein